MNPVANPCIGIIFQILTVKTKPSFGGILHMFWVWNSSGGSAYFGHFSTLTYVQPHQWKGLAETF